MSREFEEALEAVMLRTGHWPFRAMALDDPKVRVRIVELAEKFAARQGPKDVPVNGVLVRCHVSPRIGYGRLGLWLARGLEWEGIPVRIGPIDQQDPDEALPSWVRSKLYRGEWPAGMPTVLVADPTYEPDPRHPTVHVTTWETTRLPAETIPELNRSKAVVVPCHWNERVFRDNGVTVPIHVIPHGVSAEEGFTPRGDGPGRGDGIFRVGMAARTKHGGTRKNLDDGIRAWQEAFRYDSDVRLRIKTQPDCVEDIHIPPDDRITIDTRALTTHEMADWYRDLDVFLSPSRSEGWGLHGHEAMACGVPVIGCAYAGQAEYLDEFTGYPVPYAIGPADGYYAGLGEWAIPDRSGMARALRDAWQDRKALLLKSEAAERRAHSFTWEAAGAKLVYALRSAGMLPNIWADQPKVVAIRTVEGPIEKLRLAELCPDRIDGPGCCGSTRCGPQGRRPGMRVNIRDCLDCVSEVE